MQHHLHLSPGRSAGEVSRAGCGRFLNLNLLGVLPLPLQSPGPSVHVEQREGAATGGRRAGPLTLNAEAELLLLVGDIAGDSADQGHGQSTGHAGDGAGLCGHAWGMERGGVKPTTPRGSAQAPGSPLASELSLF